MVQAEKREQKAGGGDGESSVEATVIEYFLGCQFFLH